MLASAASLTRGQPTETPAVRPRVVAYVPNWIDVAKFSRTIDYAKLTHINIAFENPTDAHGTLSFHKGNAELIATAHKAGVKVLVSLGGGADSTNKTMQAHYFDLIGAEKRADFAAKLAKYLDDHDFDGLDVDLEGPAINADYGPFIEELDKILRPRGKSLTAALSEGYGGKNVPDATLQRFDFVNVMAYDGKGSWNANDPGQHSSLQLAERAIAYWRKRGLSSEKIVLGVPFYGYGFGRDFRKSPYAYDAIVAKYPGAETRDESGDTIWYNGIPTIQAKSRLVLDEKLGGVMIWSLDNDAPGDKSLLRAIDETLRSGNPAKK
ncbi:MAG: glycosyl hydrolase family 18 protein [Pirellulales bacterium]